MNDQTQNPQSLFDQLGGVLGGNKQLGVEVRVAPQDLQRLALYIFGAILLGTILGNLITRK